MILRGIVSELKERKARVTIPDNDNLVTMLLPISEHISELLAVGDVVVVGMWSKTEGAILARLSG